MNTRLVADGQSQLKEFRQKGLSQQPAGIRVAAKIISYIFHPLFIPVYISWILVHNQPYLFDSFTPFEKTITIIRFFVLYSFFPLISVLLLKALGFIRSVYLNTQKERIIPYAICMIYYFWMWFVLKNQPEFPVLAVLLSLAIFIASILGWMANIYLKVSMHAISMGVMVAFILSLALRQENGSGIFISVALLIAGLVCTARFIISDHTQREVYGGLLLGILSQLIANWLG